MDNKRKSNLKLFTEIKLQEARIYEGITVKILNQLPKKIIKYLFDGSLESTIGFGMIIKLRRDIILVLDKSSKFTDMVEYLPRVWKCKTTENRTKVISFRDLKINAWPELTKWDFLNVFALPYSKLYDEDIESRLNNTVRYRCLTRDLKEGFEFIQYPLKLKVIAHNNWFSRSYKDLK